MPPQTRRQAAHQQRTAAAATALLPLPSLPDDVWEHIMTFFTENR